MTSPAVLSTLFFISLAVSGRAAASSVPMQQQGVGPAAAGGLTTVLWSVWDDCFGGDDFTESPVVCIKSKALTALDRALTKPTLTIADGVSLAARAGKSLQFDQQSDMADRAALEAAKDSDQKSVLLDDMLASRVDKLMSTRTIVMDSPAEQEGRGKKKDKMKKGMMMMGMMMAAVMGPMMMKLTALIAIKALLAGKIALLLSGIMLIKKLMMSKQQQGGHESESSSSWGRSLGLDALDMAYSGQEQS